MKHMKGAVPFRLREGRLFVWERGVWTLVQAAEWIIMDGMGQSLRQRWG